MNSIKQAVDYTLKKKQFQLSNGKETLFDKRINEINLFLADKESIPSVGLNFTYLSMSHHFHFIYNSLEGVATDLSSLNTSTLFAVEANNWDVFLGNIVDTYAEATPHTTAVKHLGQLLYLGQYDKAKQYGNLLMKMLYGKQYDGGLVYPTHPWFMLELFCLWQGKALDKKGTRYPENLGVYQTALDNWDTQDTAVLSTIIDTLSEFHIAQSNEDVTTDEYGNEFSPEFTSSNYFIFPIEILMWLAIRKQLGLPDYVPAASNALMQLPINQPPDTPVEWVEDDLVNRCKAKLKADNPEIEFAL